MAIGAAIGAASLIPKVASAAKAAYASKHFWPGLFMALFGGQTALGQLGKAGERGLSREQLALQKMIAEAQAEATKRMTEESRMRTKEYTQMLMKAQKEERRESRERDLLESFMGSQDRQVALILQAMQGISQQRPQFRPGSSGGGMVGLIRSNV